MISLGEGETSFLFESSHAIGIVWAAELWATAERYVQVVHSAFLKQQSKVYVIISVVY
jgi:hypothetical protein